MDRLRAHVLNKLYGSEFPAKAVGLENEIDSVYDTLASTVVQRRGHQSVLLGPRASGKTLIVNQALDKLSKAYPNQFLTVKINGLAHSDDKLALREIARQLDALVTTGDDDIERASLSQTVRAINGLFDRSAAEISEEQDDVAFKRVIFVIEELDRYASMHQVLTYELLDLSQTSPIGVAVIGTSTRMNFIDLLEKRNRSRSTATMVPVPKPASPGAVEQVARSLLAIDDPALVSEYPDAYKEWNELIGSIDLAELARSVWYTSNSVRHLASQLIPHVLGIAELAAKDLTIQSSSESLLSSFESVPELDWALLICAARAVVRFDTPKVNLVIVIDEWRSIAGEMQSNIFAEAKGTFSRPGSTPASMLALRHAWERLRKLGMIEPTTSQSSQEELKMYVPELDLDDLRELLPRSFALYGWTRLTG